MMLVHADHAGARLTEMLSTWRSSVAKYMKKKKQNQSCSRDESSGSRNRLSRRRQRRAVHEDAKTAQQNLSQSQSIKKEPIITVMEQAKMTAEPSWVRKIVVEATPEQTESQEELEVEHESKFEEEDDFEVFNTKNRASQIPAIPQRPKDGSQSAFLQRMWDNLYASDAMQEDAKAKSNVSARSRSVLSKDVHDRMRKGASPSELLESIHTLTAA